MNAALAKAIEGLRNVDWRIESLQQGEPLPAEILTRYAWFPADYRAFVETTKLAVSPSEQAWLLTVWDYSKLSDSAYAWNAWELQSLDAAGDDPQWRESIRRFWDAHLPIFTSVKSGYVYFAVQRDSLRIVCGQEPEYEETTQVADSIEDLLDLLAKQDKSVERWV
jgi:hypothetical protein